MPKFQRLISNLGGIKFQVRHKNKKYPIRYKKYSFARCNFTFLIFYVLFLKGYFFNLNSHLSNAHFLLFCLSPVGNVNPFGIVIQIGLAINYKVFKSIIHVKMVNFNCL